MYQVTAVAASSTMEPMTATQVAHGHGPSWALKPCGKQMLASIQAARPVALCFRAIAAALLTSALLLQVRWDTLRFVVQILAQSRLSKA